jgi:hypothetical protein
VPHHPPINFFKMNASKRLSSSFICHSQLSLLKISNPLAKTMRSIPQCSSSRIHTSSQPCSHSLKSGSDNQYSLIRRRSPSTPLAINFRPVRNEWTRPFSTQYKRQMEGVTTARGLHSSSGASFVVDFSRRCLHFHSCLTSVRTNEPRLNMMKKCSS